MPLELSKAKSVVIASYNHLYLPETATFIYRQLLDVQKMVNLIVITRSTANVDKFPFEPVYSQETYSQIEFFIARVYRKLIKRYTLQMLSQQRYLAHVLRKEKVQLIHAQFGYGGLEILPVAVSNKVPLLVTFHGHDASSFLQNQNYLKELKNLFKYAYMVTVSHVMAERLIALGAPQNRVHVLHLGIPTDQFHFKQRQSVSDKLRDNQTVQFLQVSRLTEKKGHSYSLKAFSRFLNSFPSCHFCIAGGGPLESNLKALCKELGIQDKVDFLGHVDKSDIAQLMYEADVFLHHSITAEDGDEEGLPTVLMEAMATGLVCVSTYHAGIPELIQDCVNGYLVAEKDVDAYVEALKQVTLSQDTVGMSARKTIEDEFNSAIQNAKLVELYSHIVENRLGASLSS